MGGAGMEAAGKEGSGIYVHIPFCRRKCRYCDFLSAPGSDEDIREYFAALEKEILFSEKCEERIVSVFVGGGTPSCVDHSYIEGIVDSLHRVYDLAGAAELSVEVNPESASFPAMSRYRSLGFNRLSMGVQSFDDGELALLGRLHDVKRAEEAYGQARAAGFENINLDLMTDLPGQSLHSLEASLSKAIELRPDHLSVYSLILEEGTPFYDTYGPDREAFCSEKDSLEADRLVRQMLGEASYRRYEISNYALSGRECVHNLGYWRRRSYRGYGLGAASLIRMKGREVRFSAERDMADYISGAGCSIFERKMASESARDLSVQDEMEEFMFLGLRCVSGIDVREFERLFSKKPEDVYGPVLDRQMAEGYMEHEDCFYRYNERGMDLSNVLMADFLLDR